MPRNQNDYRDSLFGLPLLPEAPTKQKGLNVSAQKLTQDINERIASFSVHDAYERLTHKPESYWLQKGQERALALFHLAAVHVPAYKDFLKQNKVNPTDIRTIDDFKHVPIVNKENYLRAYPLNELCWYGDLASAEIISVSSGSSGKPFFWPRDQVLEAETTLEHELFLTSLFELDQKSTLFVICFAMGMYVAGPITLNSVLRIGMKGYPVTVVTPGYSPNDVLNLIPDLGPQYDQVILAGYPPYLKEIIDLGIDRGIEWQKLHVRFLLAGEGFNESWRTYVAELAGGCSPINDFINLYGSADAAVLAHETQATIIVRRRIAEDLESRVKLFGKERLPSFLQYHPEHKYFEAVNDELIFTAPGGIPLIRYNIHDSGGILTRQQIVDTLPELAEHFSELERENKLWNLPFVYVYGKSDQTTVVYGANIYPENIRRALEEEDIRSSFTGKFIMYTDLDENKDQRFHIDIECANGVTESAKFAKQLGLRIHKMLLTVNSEYKSSYNGTGEKMIPIVHLFLRNNSHFDSKSIKHSWTRRKG